jgi:hypothetical protein
VIEDRGGLHAFLKPDAIDDGRHRIQVFAVDDLGQETGSRVGRLLVDRRGPRVKLRRRGRKLTVIVSDGGRGAGSGLRRGSVRVSFGEGGGAAASASARKKGKKRAVTVRESHTFSHAGRFRVVVGARDRAGNPTRFRRTVKVR